MFSRPATDHCLCIYLVHGQAGRDDHEADVEQKQPEERHRQTAAIRTGVDGWVESKTKPVAGLQIQDD